MFLFDHVFVRVSFGPLPIHIPGYSYAQQIIQWQTNYIILAPNYVFATMIV